MSTYLVAFLVGDFECTGGTSDGVSIRSCATPDQVKYTPYALNVAKFALHYYDNYFGIHYPLKKLDLIAIPDFEAGAMENFGCITFRETAMLLDPKTASIADPGKRNHRRYARDGAPVVRRHGDHGVVEQYLAQRRLRHLDGEQDYGRHAPGVEYGARGGGR